MKCPDQYTMCANIDDNTKDYACALDCTSHGGPRCAPSKILILKYHKSKCVLGKKENYIQSPIPNHHFFILNTQSTIHDLLKLWIGVV